MWLVEPNMNAVLTAAVELKQVLAIIGKHKNMWDGLKISVGYHDTDSPILQLSLYLLEGTLKLFMGTTFILIHLCQ